MKQFLTLFVLIALTLSACDNNSGEGGYKNPGNFKTFYDSLSYSIAHEIGFSMHKDSLEINKDFFIKGFLEGIKGDSSLISKLASDDLRLRFQNMMFKKQEQKRKDEEEKLKQDAEANKKKSEEFLAENKKKPGVITTPSGLQYIVIKEGTGKSPKDEDLVTVHLKGYHMNGFEFDNTYGKEPVQMVVGQQIPGWKEAFKLMKEGAIYKVFISPELGWGDRGAPPQIPPGSAVYFEIELLKVGGKPPDINNPQPVKPVQPPPQPPDVKK